MTKRQEPVGVFKPYEEVSLHGTPAIVLARLTYCSSCDRFLDEPAYRIKLRDGSIHKVGESELKFPEEVDDESATNNRK